MEIENHVPSLETCKRMKELGWKKETYFVWSPREGKHYSVDVVDSYEYQWSSKELPAPLLSEIMEDLPQGNGRGDYLRMDKDTYGHTGDFYELYYYDGIEETQAFNVEHKNPAEAAALLWCKLVEEGIISSNEKEL